MTLLKNKPLWVVVLLMCGAGAALALVSARRGPVVAPSYADSIEEVSLTLNSTGFLPNELRPQGNRFLLSLDNRTDLKELVLRLSVKDGNQIRELRVPGGGGDWSELFELPPGRYTLSEANHTEWTCNIIIRKRPT